MRGQKECIEFYVLGFKQVKEGGGAKVNLNNQAWYDFNTCKFTSSEKSLFWIKKKMLDC